jgi:hypothetical protein
VFFGEALFGSKQPNLTYMLAFESEDALKAAWGRFGQHPEWQKLRAMAEYADNRILRNIVTFRSSPLITADLSRHLLLWSGMDYSPALTAFGTLPSDGRGLVRVFV